MTWALQDAKNKFSSVANTAWNGEPQVVTRHGKPLVVVISYKLYRAKIQPKRKKNVTGWTKTCPGHVKQDIRMEDVPPSKVSSKAALSR